MKYTVNDIRSLIEQKFPRELALEWDNPGLLCGCGEEEVRKVLIALDATETVVERAAKEDVNLILTHHPMIFKPISKVNTETSVGRRLIMMIQNRISYYAMHTNFDIGRGGMGAIVAERLGVKMSRPLEATGEANGEPVGVGFIAELPEVCAPAALAARVKQAFSIPGLSLYSAGRPISRIAVCPGSGRGMFGAVKACGADAFITGDMGHHDGLDAINDGLTLIDAGHFGLEHIYVEWMAAFMREHFPEIEVLTDCTDVRALI